MPRSLRRMSLYKDLTLRRKEEKSEGETTGLIYIKGLVMCRAGRPLSAARSGARLDERYHVIESRDSLQVPRM